MLGMYVGYVGYVCWYVCWVCMLGMWDIYVGFSYLVTFVGIYVGSVVVSH